MKKTLLVLLFLTVAALEILFNGTLFAADATSLQKKIADLNGQIQQYQFQISSATAERDQTQYVLDNLANSDEIRQKLLQEIADQREILKQKQAALDALGN